MTWWLSSFPFSHLFFVQLTFFNDNHTKESFKDFSKIEFFEGLPWEVVILLKGLVLNFLCIPTFLLMKKNYFHSIKFFEFLWWMNDNKFHSLHGPLSKRWTSTINSDEIKNNCRESLLVIWDDERVRKLCVWIVN
jgi:hypothetical protein